MSVDYYNLKKFKEANLAFENVIKEYISKNKVEFTFSDVNISTITFNLKLADDLDINYIFNRFSLDNNFKYIKMGKKIRGLKENIKKESTKNKDKRKKEKGFSFSNQITIGYKCSHKDHYHKNPLAIKIFKGGNTNITGCKDEEELKTVYNALYKKLSGMNNVFKLPNGREISYDFLENLYTFDDITYTIEMIFSTFRILNKENPDEDINININDLKKIIDDEYGYDEIKTVYDNTKQIPLRCYFTLFDKKISETKTLTSSISIHHSCAMTLVCQEYEVLYKVKELIESIINKHNDEYSLITRKTPTKI